MMSPSSGEDVSQQIHIYYWLEKSISIKQYMDDLISKYIKSAAPLNDLKLN